MPVSYDPLQSRRITNALAGQGIGHDVQVHETLESTSTHVRELGMRGYPHGTVVFAEEQTAGRGRRENVWHAEAGHNLLFSILLRPETSLEYWPRLTTITALAICRAIEQNTPLQPAIKWPNDVYIHEKKTAGILAETYAGAQGSFMVLGIGLNVNSIDFPAELAETATSVRLALGAQTVPLDRERLVISLLKELNYWCQYWQEGYENVIQATRQRSLLLGHTVRAVMDGKKVEGYAKDLDDEGHLVLVTPNGSRLTLTSAEQVRLQ